MGKKTFVCVNCGKEYQSYKPNSKYCSIGCRREYLNFKYACDYCGKEITIMKNRIDALKSGKHNNIFCSRECATNFQRNSVTKICKNCGKEFVVVNYFKDIQIYCSLDCYVDYKNKHTKILAKKCPICGTEYQTYHKEQIHCSRECARISSRTNPDAPVMPENINLYVRQHLSKWRKEVLKSAGNKCCLTGSKEKLVAHHVRSFNLLMQETINTLDFDIKENFYDYNDEDLETLLSTFLEIQKSYGQHACITENVHKLFHQNYGYGYNTKEQWDEFSEKFKNGEYQHIA